MPRTTVDLEAPLLENLKALGHREGLSLGKVISELVAEALAHRRAQAGREPPPFEWIAKPLGARIDVADKEALWAILEEEDRARLGRSGASAAAPESQAAR